MSAANLLTTPPSIPDPVQPAWEEIRPKVDLIYDDGEPMDSDWHVKAMVLLTSSVDHQFADRDDYYTGGNMFIYFSTVQARNRDFRGPDFFFVWNTTRQPMRLYWVVWEEGGRTPNVVIELGSASTLAEDRGPKKKIYETILHVNDYFIYDPATKALEGWRNDGSQFVPLKPNERGWLWSEQLGLWVGVWHGKVGRFEDDWVRFFDKDGNLVLSEPEAAMLQAKESQQDAEKAQRIAEEAQGNAEKAQEIAAESQRNAQKSQQIAEEAQRIAAEALQRTAAAEAETADLRARLASVEGGAGPARNNDKQDRKL